MFVYSTLKPTDLKSSAYPSNLPSSARSNVPSEHSLGTFPRNVPLGTPPRTIPSDHSLGTFPSDHSIGTSDRNVPPSDRYPAIVLTLAIDNTAGASTPVSFMLNVPFGAWTDCARPPSKNATAAAVADHIGCLKARRRLRQRELRHVHRHADRHVYRHADRHVHGDLFGSVPFRKLSSRRVPSRLAGHAVGDADLYSAGRRRRR